MRGRNQCRSLRFHHRNVLIPSLAERWLKNDLPKLAASATLRMLPASVGRFLSSTHTK
ncbi:MAG: hypothetical protein ACI92S_004280 [Planctomycetaceae bacterium]